MRELWCDPNFTSNTSSNRSISVDFSLMPELEANQIKDGGSGLMNYRKMRFRSFMPILLALAVVAPLRAQDWKKIDFSRLVVVGDSLAAGVQNGSLEFSQQEHGFASVIARQAFAPLVPYPGAPNTLELISAGFPPVIQPVPGTLFFPRINPFAEVTDVAVPLQ